MAGIFLSHSSRDKRVVSRLAADLSSRGIPVWFDSWELQAGDALLDRLFQGIDDCIFFVPVISRNLVSSKWCRRELARALAMEEQVGRRIVIPIKIKKCSIPSKLAGRLYVDFTGGYIEGVERLETTLRKAGASNVEVSPEKQIIPLQLWDGLFLEKTALQDRFIHLVRSQKNFAFVPEQFVVAGDHRYEKLRKAFLVAIDNLPRDPRRSEELKHQYDLVYKEIIKLENALPAGMSAIANGIVAMKEQAHFSEAAYWFCLLIRNSILRHLCAAWTFNRKSKPPLCEGVCMESLNDAGGAAKLFKVTRVQLLDVYHESNRPYFTIWTDDESTVGQWFRQTPQHNLPIRELLSSDFLHKFLVPQMVIRHFAGVGGSPLVWEFADWRIGAH
jgi:hypothetical protein